MKRVVPAVRQDEAPVMSISRVLGAFTAQGHYRRDAMASLWVDAGVTPEGSSVPPP